MSEAIEKAREFLSKERAFRLGELMTESSHPKTRSLSKTIHDDVSAGIKMLQLVDRDIPPVAQKVLASGTFADLAETFFATFMAGKRAFFTGCGATGRLSILLEAAWREFWQRLKADYPAIAAQMPEMEDRCISVMAGGDFALIKSVEGFEDFPDFGRHQLREAGIEKGDLVVAITEGGETPFVIGTAWQGLDTGARVFFVYNNPSEMLCRHVRRSREVIEEPRIAKLDLATGPMAITGSTRMQATTIELLIVGAAMEIALVRLLREHIKPDELKTLGVVARPGEYYHETFERLSAELESPECVKAMSDLTQFEENIYRENGLITYAVDSLLLDVLTDTTERSPTFMVPPFRRRGDTTSPLSWAFVKNPFSRTERAWPGMLRREPRGLTWASDVYEQLKAPAALQANPPKLDNSEILRFMIGNEPDPSRTEAPLSALVLTGVLGEMEHLNREAMRRLGDAFGRTAAITLGPEVPETEVAETFHFPVDLPHSPLRLWEHLAIKVILNTVSTATMVRMGRVRGNAMIWLSPSNKKLIDRGSRLISQVAECTYELACETLHEAMEEVGRRQNSGAETPSPVALAIDRICEGRAEH
jgi:N-acetylmuramic acid 6-phosphate etherase